MMSLSVRAIGDHPQVAKIAAEIRTELMRNVRELRIAGASDRELAPMMQLLHTLDEDLEVDGLHYLARTINLLWTAGEINYGRRAMDAALLATK
jgi:hypothetical protein